MAHAQYTGSKIPFGEGCSRTYWQGLTLSGASAAEVLEQFRAAANGMGCSGNQYVGYSVTSDEPTSDRWSGTVTCDRWGCSFPVSGTKPALKYQISLAGPGRTNAMPGGPALREAVTVTLGGAPAAGIPVSIAARLGGTAGGVTDASGRFEFIYLPPASSGIDLLTATCTECLQPATKPVEIDPCDVCAP